ncbi:hypothetical protein ACA910_004972 [Epithemia clementina (nom. ined.)]
MDLLGDLGLEDQLTSVRSENALMHEKVKELSIQVKILTAENESLKAEVEMYRNKMAMPSFSQLALGKDDGTSPQLMVDEDDQDAFVRSGNDEFPKNNEISLLHLHGPSNNLSCALSPDDVVLASGGADGMLRLVPWGAADASDSNKDEVAKTVVQEAVSIDCSAPVIALAFSPIARNVLAVGCMDGSVALVHYEQKRQQSSSSSLFARLIKLPKKHVKYVRSIAWSTKEPIFATCAADGCIYLYKVERVENSMMQDDDNDDESNGVSWQATIVKSLHLTGPVEAMCFVQDHLICYVRDKPHLTFFDLSKDMKQTKININQQQQAPSVSASKTTAGFGSDHVSFAILDLRPWGDKYLAAATDTSRNIILELSLPDTSSCSLQNVSCRIVRNLYGHTNDGFSQPKVAWSLNGQYLLGNTQDDAVVCVWDIASQQLVQRLPRQLPPPQQQLDDQPNANDVIHAHTSPIRDLCTGHAMNVLVTTAYDKSTRLWFSE